MRKRQARTIAVLALAHALAACGARTEPDDAPVDGSLEVTIDTSVDTSVDATIDATVDAYADSSDGSDASDVVSDVSADARVDADGGPSTLCGRPCPRTSCADSAAVCGPIPDGCGGLLDCGGCPSDRPICLTSVCANTPPPCAPRTCAAWGFRCGLALDGCGGIVSCGACPSGETCGAVTEGRCDPCPTALDAAPEIGGDAADAAGDAATVLVCGRPCAPRSCAEFPAAGCATQIENDGCGGQIRCDATITCGGATSCCGPSGGPCYAPFFDSGTTPCGVFCTPLTCARLGPDTCGLMGDGCGALLDCGTCAGGRACVAGRCGPCPADAG